MAVSLFVDGIVSSRVGVFIEKLGRNGLLLVTFGLDLAQYLFLLFWIPTVENSWVIYMIAVVYGIVHAVVLVTFQGKIFNQKLFNFKRLDGNLCVPAVGKINLNHCLYLTSEIV